MIAHLGAVYTTAQGMGNAVMAAAAAMEEAIEPLAMAVVEICYDGQRPAGLAMYDCVHGAGHGLAAVLGGAGAGAGDRGGDGRNPGLAAALGACEAARAALRISAATCTAGVVMQHTMVRRCRLTLSNPS